MAFCNIKKCISDYVVYFFTLLIAVALFYMFQSLREQSIMVEMAEISNEMLSIMLSLLEMISVAVAVVLGILMIYASNFLIGRRKKEFGIYMLLGMGKKEVSKILIYETAFIGICSLVAGLVTGVFFSQFLSILVGRFFRVDMSRYEFIISTHAIGKTVLNFVLIYVVVMVFHSVVISKYKLIDLFSEQKRGKQTVIPKCGIVMFFLATGILLTAYYRVLFCSERMGRIELIVCILAGVLATFFLFRSFSGILICVFTCWKKLYLKNLNSFVLREVCNGIHKSSMSMAVICLMLFGTICTFSIGFSLAHEMQENIKKLTPVDFSIGYEGEEYISEIFEKEGMEVVAWAKEGLVEVPFFTCESVTYETCMGQTAKERFPYASWECEETIMGLSDYNRLAALYGKETLELKKDQYYIVCDFKNFISFRNEALAAKTAVQIGEYTLTPALRECVDGYLFMSGTGENLGIIIVPDTVIGGLGQGLKHAGYMMAGDYSAINKEDKKKIEKKMKEVTYQYTKAEYKDEISTASMRITSKIAITENNNGVTMTAAFVVIYIGLVFLIASAALLAIKALSETIDSTQRYETLKKLGGDEKMLREALFLQMGVYFSLPLLVAVIHSVIGIKFLEYVMETYVRGGITPGVCITMVVNFFMYGGYMIVTYKKGVEMLGVGEN